MCIYIYRCHGTTGVLGTGSFGLLVGQSQTSRPQGDVFFFQFPELGDGFLLMFVGVTNRVTLWLFNIAMENPL
jgi:hypothetical protein